MVSEDIPVVVFRSDSLEETKEVAALFEEQDVACSVDREAGAGYVELTEFDAIEDAPCWAINVVESQAAFAEELMASRGFQSMADPELLDSALKPWMIHVWRFALLAMALAIVWLMIALFQ